MAFDRPGTDARQSSDRTYSEKRIGRPKRLDPESAAELRRLYFTHPFSVRQLAEMFSLSRMTVWRAVTLWSGPRQKPGDTGRSKAAVNS